MKSVSWNLNCEGKMTFRNQDSNVAVKFADTTRPKMFRSFQSPPDSGEQKILFKSAEHLMGNKPQRWSKYLNGGISERYSYPHVGCHPTGQPVA